ncbi:MAG: hypothetical protein E4H01_04665 [Lysobacterales bacterium]|nr:MAG: hypothetical protein E4H01_04665 [Xanthomonadales bacterium]
MRNYDPATLRPYEPATRHQDRHRQTQVMISARSALCAAILLLGSPSAADTASANAVVEAETLFLDFLNAGHAVDAINSGLFTQFEGRDLAAWEAQRHDRRRALSARLAAIDPVDLTIADVAAVAAMRKTFADYAEEDPKQAEPGNAPKCKDAERRDLDYATLRAALVGCYREIGNQLKFENGTVARGSALALLHDIEEPARRKALFDAFLPLWSALNGHNEPDSPYRRVIKMAATDAAENSSEVEAAARAIGVSTDEVERWLTQILDAWRQASGPAMVEPWDYRYTIGEANRRLAARIPADALVNVNDRFYRDLGADLQKLGVVYDLNDRPDKSPLAYTDFLVHGRMVAGEWRPTIARVVGSYPMGGLFSLNELVHENGHAVQISAIKNRPAFTDWPDTLFTEAFADVPSWSVYEPAWQKKYLGTELPEAISLRALFGNVVLDVAWSLFEMRMLRDPAADPNVVWTDITNRYLHIVPHPEVPWWAMRVQLVSDPGYMVNYGLGAVRTAEMRQRTSEAIGPFDAGNAAWYGWLSERLLVYGSERDTRTLMLALLGRAPSPEAVLEQILRIQ